MTALPSSMVSARLMDASPYVRSPTSCARLLSSIAAAAISAPSAVPRLVSTTTELPHHLRRIRLEILARTPLAFQIRHQPLVQEKIRQRNPVFRLSYRALPQIQHQLLGALALQIAEIRRDLLHSRRRKRLRPD